MVSAPISIFDAPALEKLRRQRRLDPQYVRVLRNRLFKQFQPDEVSLAGFPAREQVRCHTLELYRRVDSAVDGATKLLFRTAAGLLIESVVLRIASGRTTLCVSSQVGCAAACEFCATGKMGIARNLLPAEILDQVLQAGQLLAAEQSRLDNIVFMGMGEPFHNETNLWETLDALTAGDHFHRSPANILVSTVGVSDAMLRLAKRFPKVNLALSLHSVDQKTREQIMPLARRYPLTELRRVLGQCQQTQGREVMIEYLMLHKLNDAREQANHLVAWLGDLRAHVNLIPYNSIEDAPHLQASSPEKIAEFAGRLKAAGVKTTVRYSLGQDIAAACGQLVRKENRLREPSHRL
ncbi:23S rRNA (adenine(2503)-C(2))-methyltransferase RlmN [Allorhodopirellula solitaria]|uniref:23S rRNA (adenine(2503)-C(2))-methyltransferase RlmN n=1 Tax=Allorhodopirellula solitaria TaxID=2527987 RepID=UPI003703E97F